MVSPLPFDLGEVVHSQCLVFYFCSPAPGHFWRSSRDHELAHYKVMISEFDPFAAVWSDDGVAQLVFCLSTDHLAALVLDWEVSCGLFRVQWEGMP